MTDGFTKLKGIGAQKVHEKTHIVKLHVQNILNENFENMNKIQFLGFISILEREYQVQLNELKEKGLSYFEETIVAVEPETKVFSAQQNKQKLTKIYLAVAALIFIAVTIINILPSVSTDITKNQELDNSAIEDAKSKITQLESTTTFVSDLNLTEIIPETKTIVESFKIMPKSKLWLGYIELGSHKKKQDTFSDELILDPSKDWLLSLGHGNVNFEINGEVIEYKTHKNLRFLYKDGELTKINFEEFKRLNKGDKW